MPSMNIEPVSAPPRPPAIPTQIAALKFADDLFPMPKAVLDARAALAKGAPSRVVASLLETDQVLAARVVHMANTAAFRGRSPIRDLTQAVTRVGAKNLDEALIALSVFPRSSTNAHIANLLPRMLTTAAGCRIIAGYQASIETGTAFLTGLFVDMGQLLLAFGWPDEYGQLLSADVDDDRCSVVDQERQWLGFDHAELGANLVQSWDVAPEIREGVLFSHDLIGAMADGSPLASHMAAIAGFAERFTRAIHGDEGAASIETDVLLDANENTLLDLAPEVLSGLADEIRGEAFALGSVFS